MTIAAVEDLLEEFGEFSCIVTCAGGLKHQWRDQIITFTCKDCCGRDITDPKHPEHDPDHKHRGSSTVATLDGGPEKRLEQYEKLRLDQPDYVILSYDQVVDDHNMVLELECDCIVLDEITTIKNPATAVTQAVRAAFGETSFRYGLTGTPMENGKPEELFCIMEFIDDSVLGRLDIFDKTFVKRNKWGTVRNYQNLPLFHEMMQDCSASVDPDDPAVAKYMPTTRKPKRILIDFDVAGAEVYRTMSEDLQQELADAAKKSRGGFDIYAHYAGESADAETQGRIMSKISCMRMLCAHPDQLIESALEYKSQVALRKAMEEEFTSHQERYGKHNPDDCPLPVPDHKCSTAKSHKCPKALCPTDWPKVTRTVNKKTYRNPKPFSGSAYAAELYDAGLFDDLEETPKMDELVADIDQVLSGGCECNACIDRTPAERRKHNKVVVFSYHKMALRVLEERYGEKIAARYDGDMTLKTRNASKARFQQLDAVKLFLTSDAGGYGVDLPQGNHLFNLDVPFTAGRVTQRNARVRRANLDFHTSVNVRNYLMWNSLEVYYADITAAKEEVVQAVRTGTVTANIKITAASLAKYLREHDIEGLEAA